MQTRPNDTFDWSEIYKPIAHFPFLDKNLSL